MLTREIEPHFPESKVGETEIPHDALDIIKQGSVMSRYRRGQYVFHAGNSPAGLYCVNSGVVRIEVEGSHGHGHILRVVREGGFLGYRSLFSNEDYNASAVVHEDATICFIPKPTILELMKKRPEIALSILAQASRELKDAESRLCRRSDMNAAARIASTLIYLKDQYADQTWTRKEIAEMAGTAPETVIRCLADFEDRGIIRQKGRKIDVVEAAALAHAAQN